MNESGLTRRLNIIAARNDINKFEVMIASGIIQPKDLTRNRQFTLIATQNQSFTLLDKIISMNFGLPTINPDYFHETQAFKLPIIRSVLADDKNALNAELSQIHANHTDFVTTILKRCARFAVKLAVNTSNFRLLDVLHAAGFTLLLNDRAHAINIKKIITGINSVRRGELQSVALTTVNDDDSIELFFRKIYTNNNFRKLDSISQAFDLKADADFIIALYLATEANNDQHSIVNHLCHQIIKHDRIDILHALIEKNEFPDTLKRAIMFPDPPTESNTPINWADLAQITMKHYPETIETQYLSLTPLLSAAYFNHNPDDGFVDALIAANCNTQALGPNEQSIIEIITRNANTLWLKKLIRTQINLNEPTVTLNHATRITEGKHTPAFAAVHYGTMKHSEFLNGLAAAGVHVTEVDERGWTLLHHAARNAMTHPNIIRTLVRHGVNVNALTDDGLSALQIAYSKANEPGAPYHQHGTDAIVRELLQQGASVLVGNCVKERDAVRNFGVRRITKKNGATISVLRDASSEFL